MIEDSNVPKYQEYKHEIVSMLLHFYNFKGTHYSKRAFAKSKYSYDDFEVQYLSENGIILEDIPGKFTNTTGQVYEVLALKTSPLYHFLQFRWIDQIEKTEKIVPLI